MTVWTLDQVRAVRGLRAVGRVTAEFLLESDADPVEVLVPVLWDRLAGLASAHGARVHRDDVTVTSADDPATLGVVVHARWEPQTRLCEFVGGPADGTYLALPHVGDGVVVPTSSVPVFTADGVATMAAATEAVRYELSGWHERERHWIYTPRGEVSDPTVRLRT